MANKTDDVKTMVPPSELEDGEIIREISIDGIFRAEQWIDGEWVNFRNLTNAELWYARRLSEAELQERGIKN